MIFSVALAPPFAARRRCQPGGGCLCFADMYMRITMGRTKPGSWAEFETAYKLHIEGRVAPGLRARWLVRSTSDPETFFTISLWDSVADMDSYERSDAVRRQILKHIAPHLSGVSTAHHCEVRRDLPLTAAELAAMFESANEHASDR